MKTGDASSRCTVPPQDTLYNFGGELTGLVRCMSEAKPSTLLGLGLQELASLVEESGQPHYRAQQLFEALYRQRVQTAEQIATLPQDFRRSLARRGFSIGLPNVESRFVSSDRTVRYLISFIDGQSVETVWMPEGDGGEAGDGSETGDQLEKSAGRAWDRATICVSSQVGCAVDCQFCLTALLGVKRNLTISPAVRFRFTPSSAVRQNWQSTAQPTWLETQIVARSQARPADFSSWSPVSLPSPASPPSPSGIQTVSTLCPSIKEIK